MRILHHPFTLAQQRAILATGDVALINLGVLVALWVGSQRSDWDFGWFFLARHLPWFLLFSCLWLLLATANDLYDPTVTASVYDTTVGLLKILVQFVALYLLVYFLLPPYSLPRLVMFFWTTACALLIGLWRAWSKGFFSSARRERRLLLLRCDPSAQAAAALLTPIPPWDIA